MFGYIHVSDTPTPASEAKPTPTKNAGGNGAKHEETPITWVCAIMIEAIIYSALVWFR